MGAGGNSQIVNGHCPVHFRRFSIGASDLASLRDEVWVSGLRPWRRGSRLGADRSATGQAVADQEVLTGRRLSRRPRWATSGLVIRISGHGGDGRDRGRRDSCESCCIRQCWRDTRNIGRAPNMVHVDHRRKARRGRRQRTSGLAVYLGQPAVGHQRGHRPCRDDDNYRQSHTVAPPVHVGTVYPPWVYCKAATGQRLSAARVAIWPRAEQGRRRSESTAANRHRRGAVHAGPADQRLPRRQRSLQQT